METRRTIRCIHGRSDTGVWERRRNKVREEIMMFVLADGYRWSYLVDRPYVGPEGKNKNQRGLPWWCGG